MVHTNGTIPDKYDNWSKLYADYQLLEFKNKQLEKSYDGLLAEFQNVLQAVEKYGYIDLKDERTGKVIRLVEQKEEQTP